MISMKNAALWCLLIAVLGPSMVELHSIAKWRIPRQGGDLKIEPTEAIVFPGDNATFTCYHPSNVTFHWDFTSNIQLYDIIHGTSVSNATKNLHFFSKLTIYSVSRLMSGEITCSADEEHKKAIGFLIVNGVRNGGACRTSTDCVTDKATCQDGICECPKNFVRLRIKERGYDVCREMIYSLYDPCEYDEQCIHLVDPKSLCKSVCICAPWARDRRGRCVSISEITYNRSQEMYRVGLIAVTCIIILIVAVSLWVTLKRSCREQNSDRQRRSITQTNSNSQVRISVDLTTDKPPSYDDALVSGNDVNSPPNFKEALKNCMTAKRLLRQVSAPAGQLLPQTLQLPPSNGINNSVIKASKEVG